MSDASQEPIPDIRVIRGFLKLLRNSRPNLAQYISERPEMISHDETPKKAKTTKGKLNMKRLNSTSLTILLVLGCFALLPVKAVEGAAPIVGLWQVDYTASCDEPVLPPEFLTYQQFHSDGLEIESPSFSLGECMGVWKHRASNIVQIYHVGWTPGGIPGFENIVRFVFTETITVSLDGNSFDGTVDQTFYDAPVGGNVIAHCTATTHATRISAP